MARLSRKFQNKKLKRFFYLSGLVNTKTTISLRVCEERWIYIYYSPPFRGIVVYYWHPLR